MTEELALRYPVFFFLFLPLPFCLTCEWYCAHSVNGRSLFFFSSCNGRITRSIPWYWLQIGRDCRGSRQIEEYRSFIEVGDFDLIWWENCCNISFFCYWFFVETYEQPHFHCDVGKKKTKRARSFLSSSSLHWTVNLLFISLQFSLHFSSLRNLAWLPVTSVIQQAPIQPFFCIFSFLFSTLFIPLSLILSLSPSWVMTDWVSLSPIFTPEDFYMNTSSDSSASLRPIISNFSRRTRRTKSFSTFKFTLITGVSLSKTKKISK